MYRDREWWLPELQFGVSAFASLMAILMVFAAVEGVSLAIRIPAPDRIGEGIAWTLGTPLARAQQFAPFFLASFVGFRLLVPTFAGVAPRTVAVVVVTWPLVFAGFVSYGDLSSVLYFGAIGIVWALVMPLPSKNLLVYGPIIGGAIAGLAFGAFALPNDGLLFAILWCAWRLYRRHMDEVAATAIAAGFVPAVLALHDMPSMHFTGQAVYTTTEIAVLLAIATAALLFSQVKADLPETTKDADASADE
jgi:hypothetical protein